MKKIHLILTGLSLNIILLSLNRLTNLTYYHLQRVFGSVMALALYLQFFSKRKLFQLPITFYLAVAYTLGVAGTFVYKFLKV